MNKQFSDEQLDQILRQIVKDSVLSKTEIEKIADSPNIWWNVQKNIKETKTSRRKVWIPTWVDWRIKAFASAILVVCFGLFWFASSRQDEVAANAEVFEQSIPKAQKIDKPEFVEKVQIVENEQITKSEIEAKPSPKMRVSTKPESNLTASTKPAKHTVKQAKTLPKTKEIKTDFIALNYSPAAESGQIMKVKVPRSMMVTLGVTQKVENSTELVNAEVLIGDDGLARAIRFIQ